MADKHYFDDPIAEILPGQLYLGPDQRPGTLQGIDVVVGVAKDRLVHPWDHPNVIVEHVPLVDDGPPEPDDRSRATTAADLVLGHMNAGRKVLVSCYAGQNRSAWVVALVLKKKGYTGKEAVKLIRERRGYSALSNEFFEALVIRT
jgi:dual specificity protein phosphatase-like protein